MGCFSSVASEKEGDLGGAELKVRRAYREMERKTDNTDVGNREGGRPW